MKTIKISAHKDQTTGLCLDTVQREKQALVFCSSKRGAESQAEKVALSLETVKPQYEELAKQALKVLSSPTKQCQRLASCLKKGVAFHHAGLASKQRELIEDAFRAGIITIICSTPTLAAGLDLPAYRAIIRDNKRFGDRGMRPIPVLEYEQMSGRAGRPGKEDFGEAILVAGKQSDLNNLTTQYIFGEVEDIYSKLAVEPVLRTFVLSLLSTEIVATQDDLNHFFDQTFYAYQFRNNKQIHQTLRRVIKQLQEWGFLETTTTSSNNIDEFASAATLLAQEEEQENVVLKATRLGKRVSEMYLDPLTAQMLIEGLHHMQTVLEDTTSHDQALRFIHLLTCSLEMRPLLRARVADTADIEAFCQSYELLIVEDEFYSYTTDDFDDTIQTTRCFDAWINEFNEEQLLNAFNIRPGELNMKLQTVDWLCYACEELARVEQLQPIIKVIKHVRTRLSKGVKSELVPLLAFKGIGRVRARKLFTKGIKTVKDVKTVELAKLEMIVGKSVAASLKEQSGSENKPEEQQRL